MSGRVTLPTDITPTHYSLELSPSLERLDFYCNEEIHVTVATEGVSTVTMHSKEIYVESVSFKSESATASELTLNEISYNVKLNTVTFTFDGAFPVGNGVFSLRYRGILNGDMCGFYRSNYSDAQGQKKIMASTQFEALDARR
jgi:aminopeptidase N